MWHADIVTSSAKYKYFSKLVFVSSVVELQQKSY